MSSKGSTKRPKVAVFASGSGSTFQAVAEAIKGKLVDFDITLLISDHEDARVLDRVRELNKLPEFFIKTIIINRALYPEGKQGRCQTIAEAQALIQAMKDHHIDHLCLMGCLRIIAPQVIEAFGWKPEYAAKDPKHKGMYYTRMTNTHPGILPATTDTYGIGTQELVLRQGLAETAHTFHALAAGIDKGPIIAEHRVKVLPGDTPETLFARVQRIEKAHIPLDLDAFLKVQACLTPTSSFPEHVQWTCEYTVL